MRVGTCCKGVVFSIASLLAAVQNSPVHAGGSRRQALGSEPVSSVVIEREPRFVSVDCDHGERLARALEREAEELIIEFSGTCRESLDIRRGRLTLRGLDSSATIEGSIVLDGASAVVLREFTVRESPDCGICLYRGAAASLEDLIIEDTARVGIEIIAANADLRDVLTRRTGGDGIILQGAHVNLFGEITCTDNTVTGIAGFSGNMVIARGATIRVERNSIGMAFQLASAVTLLEGRLIASNNSFAGIAVAAEGAVGHAGMDIEVRNNGTFGLWVDELASFQAFFGFDSLNLFTDNGEVGIFVANGSILRLGSGTQIVNNRNLGLLADDGRVIVDGSTFAGNSGGDVVLGFGSRATFGAGNHFGTPILCDDSVLMRGEASCEATGLVSSSRSTAVSAQIRLLLATHGAALARSLPHDER